MKTFKELLEEKVISENIEEIQEMAYTDVQIACDNAKRIMEMMDEGIEPESWNYSKITMAADYLTSVYTAMRAKKSEMPDEPEMDYFSMYGEETELDESAYNSAYVNPARETSNYAISLTQKVRDLKENIDYEVNIEGLPKMYIKGKSPSEIKTILRKVVRNPDMIQSVDRVTQATIKKIFRDKAQGKEEIDEGTHKTKEGKTAKKGLWYNINKRREKGLPRKKPGDEGYPKTLDID